MLMGREKRREIRVRRKSRFNRSRKRSLEPILTRNFFINLQKFMVNVVSSLRFGPKAMIRSALSRKFRPTEAL